MDPFLEAAIEEGPEEYVRSQGVRVEVLQNKECIRMMREFITKNPDLWNEDIGVLECARGATDSHENS